MNEIPRQCTSEEGIFRIALKRSSIQRCCHSIISKKRSAETIAGLTALNVDCRSKADESASSSDLIRDRRAD